MNKKNMKMLLAITAGMTVLASCGNDDITNEEPSNKLVEMTFTAVQEGQDASTRAYIEGTEVKWEEGDAILLSDTNNTPDMDRFNNNKFTLTSGAGTTMATFKGLTHKMEDAKEYCALYPFIEGTEWVRKHDYTIVLPNLQSAKNYRNSANTSNVYYDPSAMFMIGKPNEDGVITFKNVCAFFKIHVGFTIKSITIRNPYYNTDLAAKFFLSYNNGDPLLKYYENHKFEVTIKPTYTDDNGNTQFGQAAGIFYIAVNPTTLPEGFILKIECANGQIYQRTTTKEVELVRSQVLDLGYYGTTERDNGTLTLVTDDQ